MKKKLLAALLSVTMVLSLVGCGNSEEPPLEETPLEEP